MATVFHEGRNRAFAELDAPINGSDTSIVLATGQGARLSDVTTASGRKVRANVYHRDSVTGKITKIEIVEITNNNSDVLNITRCIETTRADDSNIYAATPQSFEAGDIIEEVITSDVITELQDEINSIYDDALPLKADQTTVDALINIYAAASGGTDTYSFSIPSITSYADVVGKKYSFLADVANTGASAININGLGAIPLYKNHDVNTETDDIEVSQIVDFVIGVGGTSAQMTSQVAKVIDLTAATVSSLYDTTIPAGEILSLKDAVFIEVPPIFASATNNQNICDVTGNTRVSFPIFGSGVSGSSLNLSIKKVSNPSQNLGVRIETDDGNGSPSGTLVDANAYGTVTPAGATDATGGSTTTTGTFNAGDTQSQTTPTGCRILCNLSCVLTSVTIDTVNSTVSRVRLFSDAGAVLATATNSGGGVFTFASYQLTAGVQYRIQGDNNGSACTHKFQSSTTLPYTGTNVNVTNGSDNGSNSATNFNIKTVVTSAIPTLLQATLTDFAVQFAGNFTITNGRKCHVVLFQGTYASETIDASKYYQIGYSTNDTTTRGTKVWGGASWGAINTAKFMYQSSTIGTSGVLSKTSATYSYKIDFWGFTTEIVTAGNLQTGYIPKIIFGGIVTGFTGLTTAVTQYLSNTAGAIASSAGSNSRKIGKSLPGSTTAIKIVDIAL